jgi:Na+:H+ antiporter, NhaA family
MTTDRDTTGVARAPDHSPLPPESWAPAVRAVELLKRPIERFLEIQASSGILLLACAVIALAWANSPWSSSYHRLWHTPFGIKLGTLSFERDLHFWINDGLMVVFFFIVGLEIRREIHEGELRDLKRATLPVLAALGGMIAPALIFLALNRSAPASSGWGIPTATDIAFAVGVLTLLGRRVPPALRVLLLALAIIDDIGAILVIALFYSTGVELPGLAIAGAGVASILVLQRVGLRHPLSYALPSIVIWIGLVRSGVHPTIGGVIVGLLTPVRSWFGEQGFLREAEEALESFRSHAQNGAHQHDYLRPLRRLNLARREAVSPVVQLEGKLHPWAAYGVMPLFALANAGVTIGSVSFESSATSGVALGVALGLSCGKPLGIVLASLAGVRAGLCVLPRGVGVRGLVVVGIVGGIGFTMALFVAQLAFPDPALLGAAKVAVLFASTAAGVVGLLAGRLLLPSAVEATAAQTAAEAEESTES